MSYSSLVSKVKALATNVSSDEENLSIEYEFMPGYTGKDYESTTSTLITLLVTVTNKVTGEVLQKPYTTFEVPIETPRGYVINGTCYSMISKNNESCNWYIRKKKDSGKEYPILEMVPMAGYKITVRERDGEMQVKFGTKKAGSKDTYVNLGMFLKAVTGKSYLEIGLKLGQSNSYVLETLRNEPSREECIRKTLAAMSSVGNNISTDFQYKELRRRLYNNHYLECKIPRNKLNKTISYTKRLDGLILAQELEYEYRGENKVILENTTLTRPILIELDESSVDTVFVKGKDSEVLEVKKYKLPEGEDLSEEELFTVSNMFACTLKGLDNSDSAYEVYNRNVETFETYVVNKLRDVLVHLNLSINNQFLSKGSEISLLSLEFPTVNRREILENELKDGIAQTADTLNYLSMAQNKRQIRMSYSGRTNSEIVSRKASELGIFSQFHMPESNKIGILKYASMTAKIGKDGSLRGAYCKVENGKVVSDEPIYLESDEVVSSYIASWDSDLTKDKVYAYHEETVLKVPVSKIEYIEYSPLNNFNECIAFNSFLNHEAGKRIRMGLQDCQAYRCMKSERPIISSGVIGIDNDGIIRAKDILKYAYDRLGETLDIKLTEEEFEERKLKLVSTNMSKQGFRILNFKIIGLENIGVIEYPILYCSIATQHGIQQYSIKSSEGFEYQGNDIVAYRYDFDIKKYDMSYYISLGQQHIKPEDYGIFDVDLSIGSNIFVGFKVTNSTTVDDAMTASEEIRDSGVFTHIHLHREVVELDRKGNEMFSQPYALPVGTIVKPGSEIVFKEINCAGEKNRKTNVKLDATTEGIILDVKKTNNTVTVLIASEEVLSLGDKLSGGHGNKGVVSKIMPRSHMPFNREGKPLQLTLNPQGVPSRMNISQLLEMHMAMAIMKKGENCRVVMTPQFPNSLEEVKKLCEKYNVGAEYFRDGRTGALFDRPIYSGYLYIKKLHHTVKSKSNSTGIPSVSHPVTGQPIKGRKQGGGQTCGEMEIHAMLAAGMPNTVNALTSYYSDTIIKNKKFLKKMAEGDEVAEAIIKRSKNNNDVMQLALLRSLCVDLETSVNSLDEPYYKMKIMKDSDICKLAKKPIENSPRALDSDISFSIIADTEARERLSNKWNYLDLKCEIINPLWIYKSNVCNLINVYDGLQRISSSTGKILEPKQIFLNKDKVRKIIDMDNNDPKNHKNGFLLFRGRNIYYSETRPNDNENWEFGMDAIVKAFKAADIEVAKNYYSKRAGLIDGVKGADKDSQKFKNAEIVQTIEYLEREGFSLSDFVIRHLPIIPVIYRIPPKEGNADFDIYLKDIINETTNINNSTRVFRAVVSYFGLDSNLNERNLKTKKAKNLCSYFLGTGSENSDGALRDSANSKVIGFSFRSVIIPAEAGLIRIGEIGIPFKFTVNCLRIFIEPKLKRMFTIVQKYFDDIDWMNKLFIHIRNQDINNLKKILRCSSLEEAEKEFSRIWDMVAQLARKFPVVVGRQPTLYKFGIGTYTPVIVTGEAIRIHPTVCSGYNADFDGDQEWGFFCVEESVQEEAMRQRCPDRDYINPKDGSFILEPTQDTILGTYLATSLYKNRESIRDEEGNLFECYKLENCFIYRDLDTMFYDLYYRRVKPYYLALYINSKGNRYLSTVGRILLNSKIPNGFTDEPFTNNLGIENTDPSNYRQLKFDCQIRKRAKAGCATMGELTKYLYDNPIESQREIFAYYLDEVFKFAVYVVDSSALSIGLNDYIEHPKVDEYKEKAEYLVNMIQEEYELGLCTEKDRKASVREVYKYCTDKVKSTLLDYYDRDNNLFIMLDSGARGNLDNLNQACGLIGTIAKTNTDVLETAVMSNYLRGLSPSDQSLVSYGTVNGISNVQNNSSKSGEVTRSGVYVLNNMKIVEEDCGNIYAEEKVEYKPEIKECTAFFEITEDEFNNGVNSKDTEFIREGDKFLKKCLFVEAVDFVNSYNISRDDENYYLYSGLGQGEFNTGVLHYVMRSSKTSIHLEKNVGGVKHHVELRFKYELDDMFKELIKDRVGYELNGLEKFTPNSISGIVTDKTIACIEDEMPKTVRVRTQLSCMSVGGVCATCYGLEIGKKHYPKVGTLYGIPSIQALSEPLTQSNMDSLNKEGKGSDQSGADIAKIRIDGGVPSCDSLHKAIIANNNGFINITNKDNNIAEIVINGEVRQVLKKNLLVENGEYVEQGTLVYDGVIDANEIKVLGNTEKEIKLKQRALLRVLYNLVKSSDISISIKNYEALVRAQTSIVRVLKSSDPTFEVGGKYLLQDILKRGDLSKIKFYNEIERSSEVINCTAGFLTNLTHRSVPEQIAKIALSPSRQFCNNYSEISKLLVGQNLTSKDLNVIEPMNFVSMDSLDNSNIEESTDNLENLVIPETREESEVVNYDLSDFLGDYDLESAVDEEKDEVKEEIPTHTKIKTSSSFTIELDDED